MSLCFCHDALDIINFIKNNDKFAVSNDIYLLGVKYANETGGDIQFAITGNVNRDQKGNFLENNDEAVQRELAEELGIKVVTKINEHRYDFQMSNTSMKLNTSPETKSKAMIWYLSNKNNKVLNKKKCYRFQHYIFNKCDVYSFRSCQVIGFEKSNSAQMLTPTLTPISIVSPISTPIASPISHNNKLIDSFQFPLQNYRNNNSNIQKKCYKQLYQAYIINSNDCVPITKFDKITQCNTNIKNNDFDDIRFKVCAYVYGSREELKNLIDGINYTFKDDDNIESFVIINLNDVEGWLKKYSSLEQKPKSIFDERLKTKFTVESYEFTKCSFD
jgi:hypothetical protein